MLSLHLGVLDHVSPAASKKVGNEVEFRKDESWKVTVGRLRWEGKLGKVRMRRLKLEKYIWEGGKVQTYI